MSVNRAIAACPVCNTENEIWFYKNKVEPFSIISCKNCDQAFDPSHFVTKLLELYSDATISTAKQKIL